jgi:hypothetical protein
MSIMLKLKRGAWSARPVSVRADWGETGLMPRRSRTFAALASAFVASTLLGLAAIAVPAASAGPNFQDNWPGQVEIDYRAPDGSVRQNLQLFLPTDQQPASIQSQFSAQWAAATGGLCQALKDKVAKALVDLGYSLANWDDCSVQATGDLQAAMLSSSQLELRWLVRGNSIKFDVAAPTTPTISATFDMELDVIVNAADTIDGNDHTNVAGAPLTLQSAKLLFSNADFSTDNVFVNVLHPSILSNADNTLNSTVVDLSTIPGGPDLSQTFAKGNTQLHQAAVLISQYFVQPSEPGANEYFDFSMSVNSTNLIFTLARDGTPPPAAAAPTGCVIQHDPTFYLTPDFVATCNAKQPAVAPPDTVWGTTHLYVMETKTGFVGTSSFLENGGWANSFRVGQDYGLDPYPEMLIRDDFFPSSISTLSLVVCSQNLWGRVCTPPTTFPNPGPSASASSTGAGVGGGLPDCTSPASVICGPRSSGHTIIDRRH